MSERRERGDRGRSGRGRRNENLDEEKPGSASSKKEKEALKNQNDLIEVKTGGYSKKCVVPSVFLSILLSTLAGAGIFYIIYFFLVEFNYCPWTKMPTGCYQFFQDRHNWTEAQKLCKRRGGRLAELEGFDKQQDVVNLFSLGGHSPACFWIGGYESDPENLYFTWNTSARVMDKYFIEWESGYPKNRSKTTCVDFCHPDFSWKNKQCNLIQNYLCEFG